MKLMLRKLYNASFGAVLLAGTVYSIERNSDLVPFTLSTIQLIIATRIVWRYTKSPMIGFYIGLSPLIINSIDFLVDGNLTHFRQAYWSVYSFILVLTVTVWAKRNEQ